MFFFTFQGAKGMGKSSRHVIQSKKRQKPRMLFNQFDGVFESLPESVIVCDQEERIIRINAAALKLFEVPAFAPWKGRSYQQFLQGYGLYDEQQRPISLKSRLVNLVTDDEAGADSPEEMLLLHLPSGRKVYINLWCSPLFDSKKHAVGTVSVFHVITHRSQKALHLQRVHEVVLTLTDTIAHIPEHIDLASPEELPLLSPPVSFVAQKLVDVIRQVLSCHRAILLAYGSAGHLYYVAGSGFTAEQEQYWREVGGRFHPSEFVDETVHERFSAGHSVILAADSLHRPLPFPSALGSENILVIPLFLEQRLAGGLAIVKAGQGSGYVPEEVELVEAVAAQAALVMEGLCCLHEQVEMQARVLMQQEIQHLSNDFLTLASHELLTPLTAIIGNIQLAQRRLEVLKRLVIEQPERVSEKIEHVQHPLAFASQSAWLQKGIINDIIDYARIETKQLHLFVTHCDLGTLLKEAVAKQQRAVPGHTIVLNLVPMEQGVPILADAQRITQVFNTYLTNALKYSPIEYPVTVQLVVADTVALVSVRDEGPGIPAEEQDLLWERFYRAKESTVHNELDLSLGLGFYLCRALIEYHRGRVGVQSNLGHGETFWFTLPVVPPPRE
jgi:signal transduction histidine kinase